MFVIISEVVFGSFLNLVADTLTIPVLAKVLNINANSSNYISPIQVSQLMNKPSTLKVDIKTNKCITYG